MAGVEAEIFALQSRLEADKESGEVQVNSFLYSMGRDAEPIYGSFVFPAATEATPHPEFDYKMVVEKFDEHFVPRRNVIHDRACFHKRNQKTDETVEAFVRSLYELAQHCEFGNSKDEQIRDRIVIGISDKEVSVSGAIERIIKMRAVQPAIKGAENATRWVISKLFAKPRCLKRSGHKLQQIQRRIHFS